MPWLTAGKSGLWFLSSSTKLQASTAGSESQSVPSAPARTTPQAPDFWVKCLIPNFPPAAQTPLQRAGKRGQHEGQREKGEEQKEGGKMETRRGWMGEQTSEQGRAVPVDKCWYVWTDRQRYGM